MSLPPKAPALRAPALTTAPPNLRTPDAAARSGARQAQPPAAGAAAADTAAERAALAGLDPPLPPAAAEPAEATADAAAAPAASAQDAHAQACVRYIGGLIGQLCSHPQAQTVWSLSLPLDPDLLWSTVLHLRYCPTRLDLEFATPDWATRELLRPHVAHFQRQLQALVSPACEVWVNVL